MIRFGHIEPQWFQPIKRGSFAPNEESPNIDATNFRI